MRNTDEDTIDRLKKNLYTYFRKHCKTKSHKKPMDHHFRLYSKIAGQGLYKRIPVMDH